jgi:antitoxin HigA-1
MTTTSPSHRAPTHPGDMLLEEFLEPLSMSQAELARQLGKTAASIDELVKGKRGVSAEMAVLLSDVFGTTAEFWMNLQMAWELWHARKRLKRA